MKLIIRANAEPLSLSFDIGTDHIFRSYWTNGYDMSQYADNLYLNIQSLNAIHRRKSRNSSYREYAF